MNERTMKLRLGAAVVLSVIIIIIFLTFLGSREKFTLTSYQIKIQMVDAPNVMENTPIYQSGILIGRVAKVELTENQGVIITARIYNHHKLYHDQLCHLATTLLGDASLRMVTLPKGESIDDSQEHPHTEIKPDEIIHGQTLLDPTMLVAKMQEKLTGAIDNVTSASERLTAVASTTNEMLEENRQNVKDIMSNARSITANSSEIVESFSKILDDEFCTNLQVSVANIREAAEKFPGTMEKVDGTLTEMQGAIKLASSTVTNVTQRMDVSLGKVDTMLDSMNSTLTNVQKITAPFAEENVTVKWLANITNILRNMDTFTETLNRKDSTLGLLLTDRTMFDKMQQTMAMVTELPRKLDPILFNAQVMTEKLAQHPELLGLSGYMKKNDGTSQEIPWPKGISPYSSSRYSTYPTYSQPSIQRIPSTTTQPVARSTVPPTTRSMIQSATQSASQSVTQIPPQSQVLPTSTALKSAEPMEQTARNTQNPVPAIQSQAISPNTTQITPEMLGMTPEEFQKADVKVISDAVWNAAALPKADSPIVIPNPPTGMKAADF